jgi:alanyl-tRNA synthetase
MPRIGAHAIRRRFLDFFVARQHTEVASSPLVPQNDPSLLFVNAGMVQFKDLFLGREERSYQRAVTCQRVLRAGGKHNDLDNVGFTPRHHTFFEMLGNFSFGDYFKREAIAWAWEFLTGDLGIPEHKLCVSVFSGEGIHAPADDESFELWTQYLPRDRIYRCSAKDNFWQMGDTGPCGPCSEIHIFRGDRAPGDALEVGRGPSYEDDRYLELWNLVFMQYEQLASKELRPLPKPCIDTGAGLERIASVLAGVENNYATELLQPLVDYGKKLAGVTGPQGKNEPAFQVMADHARATAFLIADGVFPDRGGRSYVLRRIMRRAIRYGTTVGLDQLFFAELCRQVVEQFSHAYPDLPAALPTIEEVVNNEEENFRRTLSGGLKRLEVAFAALPTDAKEFPADIAAELYDTYGFPLDLSGVIAREKGLRYNEDAAKEEVKRRQAGGETFVGQQQAVNSIYFACEAKLSGDQHFCGYTEHLAKSEILAIVRDGQVVERAQAGDEVEVVLRSTPFYAEGGGQVGDAGRLQSTKFALAISDTQKPTGRWHFHRGRVEFGSIVVGESCEAAIDQSRRNEIRRNHSATHLLHHALREVLGPHVIQKGSLVSAQRLRFDFAHSRPVTAEERARLEAQVMSRVLRNSPSLTEEMELESAKKAGAIGLFGEKYGSSVRVVRIGGDSVELCGGTHVERSADIGLFAIVSETGIAQGVRRIEALTGTHAFAHYQHLARTSQELAAQVHAADLDETMERVRKLQDEYKARGIEIDRLKQKLATGSESDGRSFEVGNVHVMIRMIPDADAKVLRGAADALRDRVGSGVVVLGSDFSGKATLLVAVTKDVCARVHAGTLVSKLAPCVGGRGGGKPDLAQAGGPDVGGLNRALELAEVEVRTALSAG